VTVQDPVQVPVGDQRRQLSLQCSVDLAAPLAQFRLDEGHAKRVVDVRLRGCDQPPALPDSVGLKLHALTFG
jgi:hypothetical protein